MRYFLDIYASSYHKLKMPRKLDWKPAQGSAVLELDFGQGVRREFIVSPTHATLILYFEDCSSHSLQELVGKTQLSDLLIQKKMMLWINYGVVEEYTLGFYRLIANLDSSSLCSLTCVMDGDDNDNNDHSHDLRLVQNTTVTYSRHIIGILTTLGHLSLMRLHGLLGLLLNEGNLRYTLSAKTLAVALQELCSDRAVEFNGGYYAVAGT